MKSTGIVRKVDQLGRFVLPSELRAKFDIKDDALEVFTSGDMIVLKKYNPSDIFTGDMEDLIDYMGKKVSRKNIKELARLAGFKIVDESAQITEEDTLFTEDEL
jgi:transcriptional pleiotropic regulator of transition state genes